MAVLGQAFWRSEVWAVFVQLLNIFKLLCKKNLIDPILPLAILGRQFRLLVTVNFTWQLFRQTGVSVRDAQVFGASAQGFVWVSFTGADEVLEDACQRIAGFVDTLRVRRETP